MSSGSAGAFCTLAAIFLICLQLNVGRCKKALSLSAMIKKEIIMWSACSFHVNPDLISSHYYYSDKALRSKWPEFQILIQHFWALMKCLDHYKSCFSLSSLICCWWSSSWMWVSIGRVKDISTIPLEWSSAMSVTFCCHKELHVFSNTCLSPKFLVLSPNVNKGYKTLQR